ncbi:DUF3192 domain-containing protein [Echinimonas agarilytica]|uniref:DUF3192 domain-containing protein n=1 Tax=Echinimonas agarilytica TaxID=1215918 RepID=A0AA41W3J8_9GAMM|nr:DUF3192 domain-containing protein [Echinimonas agarilytica]MCM2678197.1 DUF3192 domain-containing protein [Echinimonas agarilytica]
MKRTVIVLAGSLIMLSTLAGCVVSVNDGDWDSEFANSHGWQQHQKDNRAAIANLTTSTSYESILANLGTPDFTENLKQDDAEYQILFYQTNTKHGDGKITKDECTPLVFKNRELIGWGDTALERLQ